MKKLIVFKLFKTFILCSSILYMIFNFGGCKNNNSSLEIYGGNHIKNTVIHTDDTELAYELPIISSKKIKKFSVITYETNGDGQYDIKTGKLTGGEKYKGWYYYFCNITVSISNEVKANFSVDSVEMEINDKNFNYKIDDLRFYNIDGYSNNSIESSESFVYSDGSTFCYQTIPNSKERIQTMGLEIKEDCEITDFYALDFLKVINLEITVNNKEKNLEDGLKLKKGDNVVFSYNLEYENNASKLDLLKTTKIIKFRDKDKNDCLFVDPQGFMIIEFNNDMFIKNIIDTELDGK